MSKQLAPGAIVIPKSKGECVVVSRCNQWGRPGLGVWAWVLDADGQPDFPKKQMGVTFQETTWRELLPAIQKLLDGDGDSA